LTSTYTRATDLGDNRPIVKRGLMAAIKQSVSVAIAEVCTVREKRNGRPSLKFLNPREQLQAEFVIFVNSTISPMEQHRYPFICTEGQQASISIAILLRTSPCAPYRCFHKHVLWVCCGRTKPHCDSPSLHVPNSHTNIVCTRRMVGSPLGAP
jgi:hypothetical protein